MSGAPAAAPSDADNPLLAHALSGALPAFDRIQPEHIAPALTTLLARQEAALAAHEAALPALPLTYAARVAAIGVLAEPVRLAWGVVSHLLGVADTPALRAAHEAMLPQVVAAQLRLGQSRPLYDSLTALARAPGLTPAQARVVAVQARAMELSGVALAPAAQERFRALVLEHDQLCQRFGHQLLDATAADAVTFTDPADVDGLPATQRLRAAQAALQAAGGDPARADPATGPWRIDLGAASLVPFLEHVRQRRARETIYRASIQRAAHPPHDNRPLIPGILAARAEQARLLGFPSYAELSLATKMAPSVAAIDALLAQLAEAARPQAERELAAVRAIAARSQPEPVALWDVPFWAERLRETQLQIDDAAVRAFFPLEGVLQGLIALVQRLFGVTIAPAATSPPVWDPAVRYLDVRDAAGTVIAGCYLDPYSRPGRKRDGAWMDVCRDRRVGPEGGVRVPVAYLVLNQTPPVGAAPSLMSFREVVTLFHEFGHGLQHLLTTVQETEAAGINLVEWDAVELPSQFLENWCYDRATLRSMARHWQTGAALDDGTIDRLIGARSFRAGSATLRQVLFARTDLALHRDPAQAAPDAALATAARLSREHALLPPLPEDRWLCGFSHIFPGGYAAGYYSYKWAEVLSADAFAAFEEAGLADQAAMARLGTRFRDTVLGEGGSRHPLEVFVRFRGREPRVEPLLRQLGLTG